jgi:MoCo/4Fe-4S cofactor protein with predicted Tat translocation signal
VNHIKADSDLEALRGDPGFKQFLQEEFPSSRTP